jgi:outer membrane protein assembly factor BamB
MRRLLSCLGLLLLVGCGETIPAITLVDVGPDDKSPPDLWTRKGGEDWPTFLGPRGDSTSAEKGLITPWPKGGPKVVWDKAIGIGYSMPTVSRGRLYLFDRIRNRSRLRALKAETGESIWMYEYNTAYVDMYGYNGGPRCSPVVDGNRIYIYGPEGMLHCVRASDGKLAWKVDTVSEFGVVQNFFGVGSTPVIEGDLLLAMVGGSPPGTNGPVLEQKNNGTALVAFDKYTGKVKYKVGDDLASYASPVLATINKRRWCFLFARGGLLALEPKSGKVDFHFPWRADLLESVNASNPVVVGNRVLISESYGVGSALVEVKPGGYKKVWTDTGKGRKKSLMTHWNTPIHVGGYVYGSSGRHKPDGELRCVELATGKVMWSKPGLTRSSLLLVDGHFVCLSETGELRLLKVNPKMYEEVSSVVLEDDMGRPRLKEPCWAAPIISHGLMWVRGEGRLLCLEVTKGK